MIDDESAVRAVILRHAELLDRGDVDRIFADVMTDDVVFMPSDFKRTVFAGKSAVEKFYRGLVESFERHAEIDIAEIEVFAIGDGRGAWARTDYHERTTKKPVDEHPTQLIRGCEIYVLRRSAPSHWRIARLMFTKYVEPPSDT